MVRLEAAKEVAAKEQQVAAVQQDVAFLRAELRDVGVLAEDRSGVWFEFDPAFARGSLEISPLRLPLASGGLVAHRAELFETVAPVRRSALANMQAAMDMVMGNNLDEAGEGTPPPQLLEHHRKFYHQLNTKL